MLETIIQEYDLTFNSLDTKYFTIPLYQRSYAWGEDEVVQLLNDLKIFYEKISKDNNLDKKYFIGNIVVEKQGNSYHIIDGQQRFTTIYLISKLINKKEIPFKLSYEIREDDKIFLENFDVNNYKNLKSSEQFKINIDAIIKFKNENENFNELLKLCQFTITFLPDGIDIVKYFEVMNNRGKQLEKHQILKAKFIEKLENNEDQINWAKLWDYCSNMNVYIEDSIYYGDLKPDEKAVDVRISFKNLLENNKLPKYFEKQNISEIISINEILKQDNHDTIKNKEEFYIRKEYSSIIKFPIFLIQVLKIYLSNKNIDIDEVVVNDRYLLEYYKYYMLDNSLRFNQEETRDFLIFLLKMRILYDYFIFKRDEKDKPFLDILKIEDKQVVLKENDHETKKLLMLQLLFNFTSPQYFTQDWLAPTLQWLYKKRNNIFQNEFYSEYENFLADFDKDLAKVRLSEIGIIDLINAKLSEKDIQIDFSINALDDKLNQGTSTPHYWFYKLDYLLWKDFENDKNIWKNIKLLEKANISNFRLTRLNSIEHIQPQNPEQDCKEWKNNNKCNINDFGNLALISNYMNSTLTNQCFKYKIEDIKKQIKRDTIESLKMVLVYSQYQEWNENNCNVHQKDMVQILKSSLK